jgi:hypothetical protein
VVVDMNLVASSGDVKAWLDRGDVWELRIEGRPYRAIIHPNNRGDDWFYVRLDPHECRGGLWREIQGFLSAQLLAIEMLRDE